MLKERLLPETARGGKLSAEASCLDKIRLCESELCDATYPEYFQKGECRHWKVPPNFEGRSANGHLGISDLPIHIILNRTGE